MSLIYQNYSGMVYHTVNGCTREQPIVILCLLSNLTILVSPSLYKRLFTNINDHAKKLQSDQKEKVQREVIAREERFLGF